MPDPVERLVNLAMTIASARAPLSAGAIRTQVSGYPPDQDDAAFMRMFERDKEDLRAAGLVIAVDRTGEVEAYRLDRDATYARDLTLTPQDATLIRAAGAAMLADPSFPAADDLRLALSKLAAAASDVPVPLTGRAPVTAVTADEAPAAQGEMVARLAGAVSARKRASFTYRSLGSEPRQRDVEPFGLFAKDGRWYLVARDAAAGELRVFAAARMSGLSVSERRPKEPDFEVPDGFDIRRWMLHPFQYGPVTCEAKVRLTGPAALRAESLAAGQGTLEHERDGSVVWTVRVADVRALASWAIENGPGIRVDEPGEASRAMAEGLARVVDLHAR